MKVSVVIPTFNRKKFISQAIDSVMRQTLSDYEIIVVDDGSTDGTQNILSSYRDKIKYFNTDHGGPAHARNIGMRSAKGEYISFLDSDDLYYSYKLELQVSILEKFPNIGMVCTEASAFDDHGYWDEFHLKKYHRSAFEKDNFSYEKIFTENVLLNDLDLKLCNWGNKRVYIGDIFDHYFQNLMMMSPSVMFRRSILDAVGLQNEHYSLFEEYDFLLRICKKYKVAFIDVPTYKVRYHDGQMSNARRRDGIHVTIEKQKKLLEIAETYGLYDYEYYDSHKELVDRRLAVLHKALAIPLMAKGKQPKLARHHLKKCAFYGYPDHLLFFLTYAPYIVRRLAIKLLLLLKKY